MKLLFLVLSCLAVCLACTKPPAASPYVITEDIDRFWATYDQVIQTSDSLQQVNLLQSQYIEQGTAGLAKIIDARTYSAAQYVDLINRYPKYWNSIRPNTLQATELAGELDAGIAAFAAIYPALQPATIYFTIGAMRTNGTTTDNAVLIGSELAMASPTTDISEFEADTKVWLTNFFGTNPIENLTLLNIHEYVHTQQQPIPDNLLHRVLYEGIAEFVSTLALDVPPATPAIPYGQSNPAVKRAFEQEMFLERTPKWLWSNAPNQFGTRDLGYYIGYAIAALHYEMAPDKQQAITELIELDYTQPAVVDRLVDETHFFSQPIHQFRAAFRVQQPTVLGIGPFENGSTAVPPTTDHLTLRFSRPMHRERRNFDYGPLGEEAVVRYREEIGYADDDTEYSFTIQPLAPNRRYQLTIGSGFWSRDSIPLQPYLIDFTTSD